MMLSMWMCDMHGWMFRNTEHFCWGPQAQGTVQGSMGYVIFLPEMLSDSSRLIKNKWCVSCDCHYLQIQSKEPTTIDMEIVNFWINVNHNYILNIELSLIVMSIHPSKEIRKTMIFFIDGLKTVWDTNFLYMDIPISKRGITLEPLCQTSQNKCHV